MSSIVSPKASTEAAGPPSLSVSVVVYHPDLEQLRGTWRSLATALRAAREHCALSTTTVDLVDNGSLDEETLDRELDAAFSDEPGVLVRRRRGHGNLGYGRGHNLSLQASEATYHLVLNPDVLLDRDAILAAIRFLDATPEVGLIAPHVRDGDGAQQYLCRAYPTVLVLFLRGFAPAALRHLCRRYMERHELRHRIGDLVERDIPLISGCFMFARRDLLQRVGGFASAYFMYFEDSELSIAMHRVADVAYVPSVRIVHFGGGAARKGARHAAMFIRSAAIFFRRNGLRLV